MTNFIEHLRRRLNGPAPHGEAIGSPYLSGSVVESPVGLILVAVGQRSNVMTVSFFSEVAHHPTTLWVSIAASAYTHTLLNEIGEFTLAVLNRQQKDVAWACGTTSGRDRDKCARLDLYRTPRGFLYLHGALACSSCRVREWFPVGDHTVFIADILEGEQESNSSHLRHLLTSDL